MGKEKYLENEDKRESTFLNPFSRMMAKGEKHEVKETDKIGEVSEGVRTGVDEVENDAKINEIMALSLPVEEFFRRVEGLDHVEVANRLIEARRGAAVAENLEKFEGLDHVEVVNRLIKAWEGAAVAENLEKFEGLDRLEVVNRLIKAGQVYAVVENLEKFEGLDHVEVANRLIKAGQVYAVVENLEKFEGLERSVAIRLIEARRGYAVAKNLEKFEGLDHLEVVNRLIEAGQVYAVAENLEKFEGLDRLEVVNRLIKAGQVYAVVENLEKFEGLDGSVAIKLIEVGWGAAVAKNLEKFEGIDHVEVVNRLIKAWEGAAVAKNLEKFEGLDYVEVANRLIEAGQGNSLAKNLEKFEGLDHVEVANRLIEAGQGNSLAKNLEKFEGLDHVEVVNRLIKAWEGAAVAENLEKFEGPDHVEVANRLIEAGQVYAVVENLEKFEGLERSVANRLIEARRGYDVVENLEKFEGLDHVQVVNRLIEARRGDAVAENLEKFEGLDHVEVANRLIEAGQVYAVAKNLEKFEGLDHVEVANRLIEAGQGNSLAGNLERFEGLERSVAIKLIEVGRGDAVAENLEKFEGLDHVDIAIKLTEAEQGDVVAKNLEKFKVPEEKGLFKLINEGLLFLLFRHGVHKIRAKNIVGIVKFDLVLEMMGHLEEWTLENLPEFKSLYDEDMGKLKIVGELLNEIASRGVGLSFESFLELRELYETDIDKFKEVADIFFEAPSSWGEDRALFFLENINRLEKAWGRKDLLFKVSKIPEFLLTYGSPKVWKYLWGDERYYSFKNSLPKTGDEARNAFTRNKYDRTTFFLEGLVKSGAEMDLVSKESTDILQSFIEDFGLSRTPVLYTYYKNIKLKERGELDKLPEEQLVSGCTSVEILKRKVKDIKNLLYSSSADVQLEDNLSKLELEMLDMATGKSVHTHRGSGLSIGRMFKDFNKAVRKGDIAEIPMGYVEKEYSVAEVDISFDVEGIRDTYFRLKEDLLAAEKPEFFKSLKKEAICAVEGKLNSIRNLVSKSGDNPHLKNQLLEFENLCCEIERAMNLDSLLVALLKIRKKDAEKIRVEDLLRRIVFCRMFENHRVSEDLMASIGRDEITYSGLAALDNVLVNVVKDHVLGECEKYWGELAIRQMSESKKSSKHLNLVKVFSKDINAIKEAIAGLESKEKKQRMIIKTIPDRGFAGEMSGYLANACYTAEYPLLYYYPDVVPYKFVMGEGEEKEFVGSVLVFEVILENGDNAMLIRAFNIPNEQLFNVPEFFERFVDDLEEVAENRGMKKILIPGVPGAISNYGIILNYLKSKYVSGNTPVSLDEEFDFNGYDLTDNCFVVRDL